MPSPRSPGMNGAPAALTRGRTIPPDDAPPIIGGRGDSDRSGWHLVIRFFVLSVWRIA